MYSGMPVIRLTPAWYLQFISDVVISPTKELPFVTLFVIHFTNFQSLVAITQPCTAPLRQNSVRVCNSGQRQNTKLGWFVYFWAFQ